MKIIVGLGNPEKNYKGTRHNIGFEAVSQISKDNNIQINKAKFRAHIGEGLLFSEKVIFMKPQTFMNLSGEAVHAALIFYKLSPSDLIVLYDDVDIFLGEIRIKEKGSAGGQKGMVSIIDHLGTDEFLRIRIGIGKKPPNINLADFVLSRFKQSELEDMENGIEKASKAVEIILKQSVQEAANTFNKHIKSCDTNPNQQLEV